MDDRASARRPNLELVKKSEETTTSRVMPAKAASANVNTNANPSANVNVVDPSTTASLGITTGMVLEGKYLVGRIVGAGAVGIVFEAKNVELDETVAIKCLRPEMLVDTAMVARFAREAKAAAAIKSEYVATVYDVGTTEDGVPYMVMEFLDGKDLGTVVAEQGTIGPRTAVEYALQVCEALAVAHSKGIVHRDIKPENLLLTERAGGMRIVKVLDFGISKTALTGSIFKNELPIVKTVNLMGTPLYMSPEQVRISDSVDIRSDIWSLGMVIYEILTGQTAFSGSSITEICASILEAQPHPIEMHRNDLPSGLVEVVTRCLQKDVSKRYQNIAELALALMPFGPKRTRLNVERAVAILQAAGQLDARVRVNSTVPPGGEYTSPMAIPKAPQLPTPSESSVPSGVARSSSSLAAAAAADGHTSQTGISTTTPSAEPPSVDSTIPYPESRSKKPVVFLLLAAAVLIVGGVAAGMTIMSSKQANSGGGASNTGTKTAETSTAPTAAVVVTSQIPTTTTPVTTTPPTPSHAETTPPATTTTTAAAAATPKSTPPAWAVGPRPGGGAAGAAHPPTAPTARTSAATAAATNPTANTAAPSAKPRPSGKPDEPDLGY